MDCMDAVSLYILVNRAKASWTAERLLVEVEVKASPLSTVIQYAACGMRHAACAGIAGLYRHHSDSMSLADATRNKRKWQVFKAVPPSS
jgi:hypothetical protein